MDNHSSPPGYGCRYVPTNAMTLGEHYFVAHPRIAFLIHGITAISLGYVSNVIQQYWYPESYLWLYVSIWWTLSVIGLIHLANKPRPLPQPEHESQSFKSQLRLHALMFGDSRSFHDAEAEKDEDYPAGTALFRSIGISIQGWRLATITVSPDSGGQSARFNGEGNSHVTLQFDYWGFAWHVGICQFQANEQQVRDFLASLQAAISGVDGLTAVQWYDGDPDFFHAQMSEAEIQLGGDSPFAAKGT